MRHIRRSSWLPALLLILVMLAAACGSSSKKKSSEGGTTETTAAASVPTGGTLVVGAEQEPDCTDFMGSCGGSTWGTYMMSVTTLPYAFNIAKKPGDNYEYEPSIVLAGEPELKQGNPTTITYKINPKAKWSDGQPITSADIKFTWDQVANGKDIYDRTGYEKIASVDTSKPDTAVVTFKPGEFFADWKSLFSEPYGILPSHLIKDHSEMANGFTFSGGPWKIDHWTKGTEAVLVPNENYWGTKPKLDKVVFKFISDTAAEFQAFKAGETMMGWPQPQLDVIDAIAAGGSELKSAVSAVTGNAEALWFNNEKPPFNDKAFRQAVGYAIDRDAVVNRLFGKIGVTKALNTVTAPTQKAFATSDAFAKYKKDLSKVETLMTSAGWKKGTDGIWEKGGQKATFEVKSTAGNKRRELTEQVVQQQLKEAGFDMKINNQKAGDLFGSILPKGDFQVGLFANVLTSIYPSNCNLFCTKNVPTAANNFSGNNWYRVRNAELDKLLLSIEKEPDEAKAQAANKQADKLIADNAFILPLDPLPIILIWNGNKVVGPVQDNAVMGPFFYANLWGVKA